MLRTAETERVVVSSQVPWELREQLEQMAREADRTLSAEIRRALVEHLRGKAQQQ